MNNYYIKFVAAAIDLATSGATLVNTDGLEWPIVPQQKFENLGCPARERFDTVPKVKLKPNQGNPGDEVPVKITGPSDTPLSPKGLTALPKAGLTGIVVKKVNVVKGSDNLDAVFKIPGAAPTGEYIVKVPTKSGLPLSATFYVGPKPAAPSPKKTIPLLSAMPDSAYAGEDVITELQGFNLPLTSSPKVEFNCFNSPDSIREKCDSRAIKVDYVSGDDKVLRLGLKIDARAQLGPWKIRVVSGDCVVGQAQFTVKPGRAVYIQPFDATNSLVTILLYPAEAAMKGPDVVVIGKQAFGLRDAPYYERADDHVTVVVGNDVIRANRKITWQKLMSGPKHEYSIPFDQFGASDVTIGGITAIGSAPASGKIDVFVRVGNSDIPAQGSGVLTIGDGTAAVASLNPPGGQRGETVKEVLLTAVFTKFIQSQTKLTFDNAGVSASSVAVQDDTHLTADILVKPEAKTGPVKVTVQTGAEEVTGVFTVGDAAGLIQKIEPLANGKLKITGDGKVDFTKGAKVKFGNSGITVEGDPEDVQKSSLTVKLSIAPDATPGRSDVSVVTGALTATGTGMLVPLPYVVKIRPAGMKPGQTYPGTTITLSSGAILPAEPRVWFSGQGIAASTVQGTADPLKLAATVNVKTGNRFAIQGTRLTGLRIIEPPIDREIVSDTLVIFSLSDDQSKNYKNIVVRNETGQLLLVAIPAASPPAATGPKLNPQKPNPAAGSKDPITVQGNGMSDVVSVRYNDKPLSFSIASDSKLIFTPVDPATGNSILQAPAIVVVFVYKDKSLIPYPITVAKAAP